MVGLVGETWAAGEASAAQSADVCCDTVGDVGSPHQHPSPSPATDRRGWTDERLVAECLEGNDAAWSALVDRYKALVYSVPARFGMPPDSAKEVFQEVWLSLLRDLPSLREPRALPAWLAQTAWHKCMHWKRGLGRFEEMEADSSDSAPLPYEWMAEIQAEQALRDSIAELPQRCVRLIEMLFFETPPIPYQQAAERLHLATGSISFVRKRCLDQLKARLQTRGLC